MTGRIFRSICLVATGVLLAALVLIMGVLYSYYTNIQRDQLADETLFAAQGYEQSGLSFFDGLNIDVRVTLIAADGRVIYDSESDVSAMENHAEREEVAEAFESGEGEATRTSSTITTAQMYFAKRLSDGNVIRLSTTQYTFVTLTMSMLHPLIIIMLGAIICALVLASGLSKKIVEPLNTVNLDEPLKNEGYDELAPLLRKIDAQQKKIRTQKLELLQRKKEFAAVTDKMSEGLILLGTSGHIISINRAASFLLGTSADCEGSELVFICRKPKLNMLVDEAKSGRRAEQIAELNGREYKFTANPVFSDDEVSGIVLLILDVTENVDAERMRREFTANVSHELKTPLQT
ncbi:MAG: PAS domain-containing sensor histidine kinase, partial [Clostridia bacterium]|nr:PAS domain-containing sensor histidine kinase [Clostridia bacterium]